MFDLIETLWDEATGGDYCIYVDYKNAPTSPEHPFTLLLIQQMGLLATVLGAEGTMVDVI